MTEIKTFLLPYKRYNCFSFSDVACWKSYLEFFYEEGNGINIFERCVADAGRDYGGRLLTIPIHPQVSVMHVARSVLFFAICPSINSCIIRTVFKVHTKTT